MSVVLSVCVHSSVFVMRFSNGLLLPFFLSVSFSPQHHHCDCCFIIQVSASARASRICQVRRSTVVVHGEVMVIRKLVVAGIVTAERSYLECLMVMKEVIYMHVCQLRT